MKLRLTLPATSRRGHCLLVCRCPSRAQAVRCRQSLNKLPRLEGRPIQLEFLPKLTVSGGRLLTGQSRGGAVHAAAFVRERRIAMDADLIRQPAEFHRILTHELFHFVWVRLGNVSRMSWQRLIESELKARARGELGWSAAWRKETGKRSGRTWREYLCESFCDTGAWLYSRRPHEEFTLGKRACARRARWMSQLVGAGFLPI